MHHDCHCLCLDDGMEEQSRHLHKDKLYITQEISSIASMLTMYLTSARASSILLHTVIVLSIVQASPGLLPTAQLRS